MSIDNNQQSLTIETLRRAMSQVHNLGYGPVHLSSEAEHRLRSEVAYPNVNSFDAGGYNPWLSAAMPIYRSSVFPYQFECSTCGGTGEGTESTYCKRCHGAGEIRVIGMQSGPKPILITEPLPKKFEPHFPKGLVPAAPLSKGLV